MPFIVECAPRGLVLTLKTDTLTAGARLGVIESRDPRHATRALTRPAMNCWSRL